MINIIPNLIALNNAVNLMNLSNQTYRRNTTYVLEQQRLLQQEEDERHRREVEEQKEIHRKWERQHRLEERRNTVIEVAPISSEEEKRQIEKMLDDWTAERLGQ